MDSPGLFDTTQSHEVIAKHIEHAIGNLHPHAVLFIFPIGCRFTEEEFNTFDRLKRYFGQRFVDRMVVVFTRGDRLEESGESIEEYLNLPDQHELQKILHVVFHRYVVFNNRALDHHSQVHRLLNVIQSMGGSCYEADGLYQETIKERLLQAEQAETHRKPHFIKMEEKLRLQLKQERIEAIVHNIERLESEISSLEYEAARHALKIVQNEIDIKSKRLVSALQISGSLFTLGLSLIGVRERWKEMQRLQKECERLYSERVNLLKKVKCLQEDVKKLECEFDVLMVERTMEDIIKLSKLLVDSNAIDTRSKPFENLMKETSSFWVKYLDMCMKSEEFQNMAKEMIETLTPKESDIDLD